MKRGTIARYASAAAIAAMFGAASAVADAQPDTGGGRVRGELEFDNPPWTGDLDGMVKRRSIRALLVYSRFQYRVVRGHPRGPTYDLLREFEKHINKKYKTGVLDRVHVLFVPTSRDDLIPALIEGRGDVVVPAITITPERQKRADFSDPILRGGNGIPVTGPQSPLLRTLDHLAGKEVFVRKSSSYYAHLERLNERFAREDKEEMRLWPAPESLENEDLLEMVNAGLIGIVIVPDFEARLWANLFKNLKLHPQIAVSTDEKYGWMVRQGSPRFRAEINEFIRKHGQGTPFGNYLIKRYTVKPDFITDATSPEEFKKYQATVALFRKYSDRYDMDYLLMMAMGYQESRLDQRARSPKGAIGVMQIMPATGRDLRVGDITRLEPNIHGGVKYFRLMMDEYFANEPADRLNRSLFAFAAYNAGPGRIIELRRDAARRGLNPNVWFGHVERVAAQRSNEETVAYVSHIYKYYIAYKLAAEKEEERRKAREDVKKEAEG